MGQRSQDFLLSLDPVTRGLVMIGDTFDLFSEVAQSKGVPIPTLEKFHTMFALGMGKVVDELGLDRDALLDDLEHYQRLASTPAPAVSNLVFDEIDG